MSAKSRPAREDRGAQHQGDPASAVAAAQTLSSRPFVELSGGSLAYGNGDNATLAVDGLDLSIDEGRFVSVVGPSGCGKSTLMKIVTGLVPMTSGTVRVGGDLVRGPVKIAGMAFQNATLLPWRTTLDNVMLPLEIVQPHRSRLRTEREQYRLRARALLATVGLEGFEDRLPWQLSGGMQQRASLCRALIHEPRLLMLDEPFGALDAFTREELWVLLHDLWEKRRFTVVLVTHDLREAAFLSDTVLVMSKRPGRIIARRDIPRDGPRRLENTYTPQFAAILQELREHIGRERTQ
jgi:NitT/TauT family transport system ATP-binding protein